MNREVPEASGIGLRKLWTDPEIIGRIYLQVCALQLQDLLPREEQDRFWKHATSVMHKLSSTKYHLENYKRLERQEVESTRRRFKKQPSFRREAFELIFEIEAFLFQVKSSLDMLGKLLGPLIGDDQLKLHTFKDKGDGVVKALEQYKKRGDAHTEAVDSLIRMIQQERDGWISVLVGLRDSVSHYEAISNYVFEPYPIPGGAGVRKPRLLSGHETVDALQMIYSNNVGFHQDFISVAASVRLKQLVLAPTAPGATEKMFGQHAGGRFVKWGWALRGPVIPPPADSDSAGESKSKTS